MAAPSGDNRDGNRGEDGGDNACDNGGDNKDLSESLAKFLDLQERIEATKQKLQKLMNNSGPAGFSDYPIEEAEDNNTEFEDFTQRLQDFVDEFCPNGVENLDPLLAGIFSDSIQSFAQEFDIIDVRISENLLGSEGVQAIGMAGQQLRSTVLQNSSSLFDLPTSGDLAVQALLRSGIKAIGNFDPIKFHEEMEEINRNNVLDLLKAKQLQSPGGRNGKQPASIRKRKRQPGPADLVKHKKVKSFNRQLSGTDRPLKDILMEMYGFEEGEAKEMAMGVVRSTLPPEQGSTAAGSSTGAMKLNLEGVKEMKQELQTLKIWEKKYHAWFPVLLRDWIFRLETQVYNLVRHLRSIMSGHEAATERLRQLRSSLGEFRQVNQGMVPMVVNSIHAMLEMQAPVESALNRDQQEELYRELGFDHVIDSIHGMLLNLRFVLMVSGSPKASTLSPHVLDICEQVLKNAEEELERIDRRTEEGKKHVEKKRKRDDEAGGSWSGGGGSGGSGSGSGGSGMSEKARGKMVMREW